MKIINSNSAPAPIGPYSQAVLSGRTLYVSGQIPTDPATGELISGNIQREAEQVMDAVEPRATLGVRVNDIPRSLFDVRVTKHVVFGF